MRKLIIIGALMLLLTGCTEAPQQSAPVTEDTTMAATTTSTEDSTTTESSIVNTTTQTTTIAKEKLNQVNQSPVETTKTAPKDKTITINVETESGDGNLTFVSVLTYNDYRMVRFHYQTTNKETLIPVPDNSFLIGKSGKKYSVDGFGGMGDKGDICFSPIPDFSDLSHVKLTYQFKGHDPVTVEFEIPGI